MTVSPKKILIIYTGGTIGMIQTERHPHLKPVDLKYVAHLLPEISKLSCIPEYLSFETPIDSSNMLPETWQHLAALIEEKYDRYDGFVILHGTDTMAYTASALSFMLENLDKPVILTGAQLPIDVIRSDARENLITALEIASHPDYVLHEVAIYFDAKLFRGNRSIKNSAEKFHAFVSPNFPPLAEAGVDLEFYTSYWLQSDTKQAFSVQKELSSTVGLIKFFPGMPQIMMETLMNLPGLQGMVFETFGTGNLPSFPWFIKCIKERIDKGLVVMNVTQCTAGKVVQERYENSKKLLDIGVISGHDLTAAAAVTKLMYLFGKYKNDTPKIIEMASSSLRGEMNI